MGFIEARVSVVSLGGNPSSHQMKGGLEQFTSVSEEASLSPSANYQPL